MWVLRNVDDHFYRGFDADSGFYGMGFVMRVLKERRVFPQPVEGAFYDYSIVD